jgi:superoxide dismutase, Fe-Mn family
MFELQPLSFEYTALEPIISKQTLEFHHDKHHAGYVNKLNQLLENTEYLDWTLEKILTNLDSLPESLRSPVKNNAGQVYNHNLYWESLSPKATKMSTILEEQILRDFATLENFYKKLAEDGETQFGSGWAWLSFDKTKLVIEKTSNAESPLMFGRTPLLVIDVWEHAYYLDYQNLRPKYIQELFKLLNWDSVSQKFQKLV